MLRSFATRPKHRIKVASAFRGTPHIVEHEAERRFVHPTLFADLSRDDANSFLQNVDRATGETSRSHIAHVGSMAPHGREQQKFFLHKNRTKHQYIVEMRTSGIWIIVQEDIAWIDVIFEIVDDFSSRNGTGKIWIGLSSSD